MKYYIAATYALLALAVVLALALMFAWVAQA